MSWRTSTAPTGQAAATWRRVVRDALRFDPSGLIFLDPVRMTVGTMIPLIVGFLAGSWATGAAAAGGALSVGIASVVPSTRPRYALLASTAGGMAVGTFIGCATSSHPVVHVVAGALLAFAGGLLVAVQPNFTGAGINTLVAFLVYGRFSAPPLISLRTAGFVALGGLLQLALVVVSRRRPRAGRALNGLSLAYRELAALAADLRVTSSSLPAAQAIDAAGVDLEFSLHTTGGEAWTSLAGEAHRVRLELLSLASARSSFERSDDDRSALLADVGTRTADFLECVAASLRQAELSPGCDDALDRLERAVGRLEAHGVSTRIPFSDDGGGGGFVAVRASTAARAIAGQLRAIAALLPDAVSVAAPPARPIAALRSATRVSRRGVHGAEVIAQRMLANITPRSDAFTHALRLAVVVMIATAVAHVVGLGRGYWLALTTVLILRPEFATTFTRGVARATGTLLGVAIATGIAVATSPHGWSLVVFVACSVWLCGALFNASYVLFSIAVTGVVVFLLEGIDRNPVGTGEDRLLSTVLGAALALLSYAVWPTWGKRPAAEALADLAAATHRYVTAVLRAYLDPAAAAANPAALSALSRAVRLARTNSEAALDRSLADPRARQLHAQTTASLLAALRRVSITAHTMRLRRPDDARALRELAGRELAALTRSVDVELGGVAARLRFGRVTRRHEPLRDLHRALFDAVAQGAEATGSMDPTCALVVAETDELVDAVNSLTAVIAANDPPRGQRSDELRDGVTANTAPPTNSR
ncbi:MAG TPA: FUSC family protein [Acidothermaceae bacterium]